MGEWILLKGNRKKKIALSQEKAKHIQGTTERPVWQELNDEELYGREVHRGSGIRSFMTLEIMVRIFTLREKGSAGLFWFLDG